MSELLGHWNVNREMAIWLGFAGLTAMDGSLPPAALAERLGSTVVRPAMGALRAGLRSLGTAGRLVAVRSGGLLFAGDELAGGAPVPARAGTDTPSVATTSPNVAAPTAIRLMACPPPSHALDLGRALRPPETYPNAATSTLIDQCCWSAAHAMASPHTVREAEMVDRPVPTTRNRAVAVPHPCPATQPLPIGA